MGNNITDIYIVTAHESNWEDHNDYILGAYLEEEEAENIKQLYEVLRGALYEKNHPDCHYGFSAVVDKIKIGEIHKIIKNIGEKKLKKNITYEIDYQKNELLRYKRDAFCPTPAAIASMEKKINNLLLLKNKYNK